MKWTLVAVASILLVGVVMVVWWVSREHSPTSRAEAILANPGPGVSVTIDDGVTFVPTTSAGVGLIVYPGAGVDPGAYAAVAREVAVAGYIVVIPNMPLDLAVLDEDAADGIIAERPEIKRWVIGGHSLGRVMAAAYTDQHRTTIDGLVLWASYPADSNDLSDYDGRVTSISGREDGLSTPADIADTEHLLPPD